VRLLVEYKESLFKDYKKCERDKKLKKKKITNGRQANGRQVKWQEEDKIESSRAIR